MVHITAPGEKLGVRLNALSAHRIEVTMVVPDTICARAGVTIGHHLYAIHLPSQNPTSPSPSPSSSSKILLAETQLSYADILTVLREKRPLVVEFELQGESGYNESTAASSSSSGSSSTLSSASSRASMDASRMTMQERCQIFSRAIEVGDERTLQALGLAGIPDHLRADVWKVLLKYFSHCSRQEWKEIQKSHLHLYREYKAEFLRKDKDTLSSHMHASRRPARLAGQG